MNNTNNTSSSHVSYRYIGDVSRANGDGVIVLATSLDRSANTVSVGVSLCRPETSNKKADRYDKRFLRSVALFRLRMQNAVLPEHEQAAVDELELDLKNARTRVKKSQTYTRIPYSEYLNARQQKPDASEINPAWLGYRKVEATYFTAEDFVAVNGHNSFVCDIEHGATHKDIDEAILTYMLLEMRFPKWAQSLIADALDSMNAEDEDVSGAYSEAPITEDEVTEHNEEFAGVRIVHNTAREWWYLAKDPDAHPSDALTPLCESREDLFIWLRGLVRELESDEAVEVEDSFTEDDIDEDVDFEDASDIDDDEDAGSEHYIK